MLLLLQYHNHFVRDLYDLLIHIGQSTQGTVWFNNAIEPSMHVGNFHDDVIKWKHFRVTGHLGGGFHRSPVNSTHKGQWHGALMFSLICARINGWLNNREAGDLGRRRAHYDVTVMQTLAYHIKTDWTDKSSRIACDVLQIWWQAKMPPN